MDTELTALETRRDTTRALKHGMMLTFNANPARLKAALGEATPASVKTSVETSVKTPVEVLRLLTANPSMTLAEVAAEIGKTPRAIELAASKLVKDGRLKYVGPQKGGHWEVLGNLK